MILVQKFMLQICYNWPQILLYKTIGPGNGNSSLQLKYSLIMQIVLLQIFLLQNCESSSPEELDMQMLPNEMRKSTNLQRG